jgi:hypothetical protein
MRLPLLHDAILEPKARCFLAGNKSLYGTCMILNRQSPISSPTIKTLLENGGRQQSTVKSSLFSHRAPPNVAEAFGAWVLIWYPGQCRSTPPSSFPLYTVPNFDQCIGFTHTHLMTSQNLPTGASHLYMLFESSRKNGWKPLSKANTSAE